MDILYILVPLATGFSLAGLLLYLRAARSGQFSDPVTPAHRMLLDDEEKA